MLHLQPKMIIGFLLFASLAFDASPIFAAQDEEAKRDVKPIVSEVVTLTRKLRWWYRHKPILKKIAFKMEQQAENDIPFYQGAGVRFLALTMETLVVRLLAEDRPHPRELLKGLQQKLRDLQTQQLEQNILLRDGAILGLTNWLIEVISHPSLKKPYKKRVLQENDEDEEQDNEGREKPWTDIPDVTVGQLVMLDLGLYAVVAHSLKDGIDSPVLSGLKDGSFSRGKLKYNSLNELMRYVLHLESQKSQMRNALSKRVLSPTNSRRGISHNAPSSMIISVTRIQSQENIDFALELLRLLTGDLFEGQLKKRIIEMHSKSYEGSEEDPTPVTLMKRVNVSDAVHLYLGKIEQALNNGERVQIDINEWLNQATMGYKHVLENLTSITDDLSKERKARSVKEMEIFKNRRPTQRRLHFRPSFVKNKLEEVKRSSFLQGNVEREALSFVVESLVIRQDPTQADEKT